MSHVILLKYYSNGRAKRALEKNQYYSVRFAILTILSRQFLRPCYSNTFRITILTKYYSHRRAKRTPEKINIICTRLQFYHRIVNYSYTILFTRKNLTILTKKSIILTKFWLFVQNPSIFMKKNLVLFTRSGYSYTESIAILTQYYSHGARSVGTWHWRAYWRRMRNLCRPDTGKYQPYLLVICFSLK